MLFSLPIDIHEAFLRFDPIDLVPPFFGLLRIESSKSKLVGIKFICSNVGRGPPIHVFQVHITLNVIHFVNMTIITTHKIPWGWGYEIRVETENPIVETKFAE